MSELLSGMAVNKWRVPADVCTAHMHISPFWDLAALCCIRAEGYVGMSVGESLGPLHSGYVSKTCEGA